MSEERKTNKLPLQMGFVFFLELLSTSLCRKWGTELKRQKSNCRETEETKICGRGRMLINKNDFHRTPLAVQWLRVPVSTAGSTVSISIGIKILYGTWCASPSTTKKKKKKKLKVKLKMTFTDTTLYRSQVLFLLCYTYTSPHSPSIYNS